MLNESWEVLSSISDSSSDDDNNDNETNLEDTSEIKKENLMSFEKNLKNDDDSFIPLPDSILVNDSSPVTKKRKLNNERDSIIESNTPNNDLSEIGRSSEELSDASFDELLPLRYQTTISKQPLNQKSVKESPAQWRNRIWPRKPIDDFLLGIFRCETTNSNSGWRIFPYWTMDEISKVNLKYDSFFSHYSTFYKLLLEETVAGLNTSSSSDDFASSNSKRSSCDCILDGNISVLRLDASSSTSGGDLWRIRIRVPHSQLDLISGDVIILQSLTWKKNILACIHGWEPDALMSDTYIGEDCSNNGEDDLVVYAIVAMRSSQNHLANDKFNSSSFAESGMIRSGMALRISLIGNILTSIRECQALFSLRYIDDQLQDLIRSSKYIRAPSLTGFFASISASTNLHSLAPSNSSVVVTKKSLPKPNAKNQSISADKDNISSFFHRSNSRFWDYVEKNYNSSQVSAIVTAYESFSTSPASISLIQGPPGTGKTKTILGMIGALLLCNTYSAASDSSCAQPTIKKIPLAISSNSLKRRNSPRILVCAPSNTAVDEIVFRLMKEGVRGSDGNRVQNLHIVRIGNPGGRKRDFTDGYVNTNNSCSTSLNVAFGESNGGSISKIEPNATNNSSRFAEAFGKSRPSNENNIEEVTRRVSLDYLVTEYRNSMVSSGNGGSSRISKDRVSIQQQILARADIICCTLSGAGSQPLVESILQVTNFTIDCVIIDEAAQATEPSSLIPLKFNPRSVILIGDANQLPALVHSPNAKALGYGQSLFQRLLFNGYPSILLNTQYRMHPDIMSYPSLRFYQGLLKCDETQLRQQIHSQNFHSHRSGLFRPFLFHDIASSKMKIEGTSACNVAEADFCVNILVQLQKCYPNCNCTVGIIAPYAAQRRLLKKMLTKHSHSFVSKSSSNKSKLDVEISTVDGFQGREKDIIIFSCVRAPLENPVEGALNSLEAGNGLTSSSPTSTSTLEGVGFLKEWQRLNVAITRARNSLWIVGNIQTLEKNSEWSSLIQYCQQNGKIQHW